MGQDVSSPTWSEAERIAALKSYDILDTPPEPDFDDVVRLVAQVCEAPRAAINLIDDHRQWFKAEVGLGMRETPLDVSICAEVILQPGLTVIPDVRKDPRFASNPLVTGEPHIRFYAGVLLETSNGLPLGTLCVLDDDVRGLSEPQAFALQTLARQVMALLELRRALVQRDRALAARERAEQQQTLLTRELHHRVKNTLATVQAVAGSTARSATDMKEFRHAFSGRIAALAKTHAIITDDVEQRASVLNLLRIELARFAETNTRRVTLRGPGAMLSSEIAIPLGMAIHELTSNSVKYGSLSTKRGRVTVTWTVTGSDTLHLEWLERGGPTVQPPNRRGYGSRVLDRVLRGQARAEVTINYDPSGLHVLIDLPLSFQRAIEPTQPLQSREDRFAISHPET
jgi:two-component sensor histidine kinase